MKHILTLLLLFFQLAAMAQTKEYHITFDSLTPSFVGIGIDTNDTVNKWQIGEPSKTVFTSGYGGPKAIVTDTLSPCVPNDTSVFIVAIPAWLKMGDTNFLIRSFSYWQSLDLDTGDYAYVEENAFDQTFELLRKDSNIVTGWQYVSHKISSALGPPNPPYFRFKFITGSNTKSRDGWMLDSFTIRYTRATDIEDIQKAERLNIYPNPASNVLHIKLDNPLAEPAEVKLSNAIGQCVVQQSINASAAMLDVSDLPVGVYWCTITLNGYRLTKKILIVH